MRREIRRVVSEPAEVHELTHALLLGRPRNGASCQQVALFEVARSQGVHEVVGDVDAVQGAAHGALVRCVGDRPIHAVAFMGTPRHGHHVVPAGEQGKQRVADRPRGPEDCDPHVAPSRTSRAK